MGTFEAIVLLELTPRGSNSSFHLVCSWQRTYSIVLNINDITGIQRTGEC